MSSVGEAGNVRMVEEGEEEVEEEEELLNFYVPYIHNGYIYDFLTKHSISATADMLFDLPLCRHNDRMALARSVQLVKEKRKTLMKAKSKSVKNENVFQQFLNAEFVFPVPSTSRSYKIVNLSVGCICAIFIKDFVHHQQQKHRMLRRRHDQ